ncbi:GntR family transcriptional regulator [Mesorhizobium sp. M1396]
MDLDPSTLNRALPLRDQIYHQIRNLIVIGQMRPGDVISEVSIAEALGVSRTPVREAVKRISDEGLVNILAQTGTYVAPISRADLEEAYIIRRALEMESTGARPPNSHRQPANCWKTIWRRTGLPYRGADMPPRYSSTTSFTGPSPKSAACR